MKTIMWLEELNYGDLPKAGGKGANLGEMVRAGMPVPPGFVISIDAYRRHLANNKLDDRIIAFLKNVAVDDISSVEKASNSITEVILNAPIPNELALEITNNYKILSENMAGENFDAPVAVRSSATAEDLPGASFAGQQETYLNIIGKQDVLKYVRLCWASLWSSRAISYRVRMGYDHLAVSLAVVVQAMIPAQVAGVMFTANPMNGSKDELLITANYGLGESVVSGLATPDTFIVSVDGTVLHKQLGAKELRIVSTDKGTKEENPPDNEKSQFCLDDSELQMLASLARKVSAHYGTPQDIEWAISQGRLFLLQSRPITALPAMSAVSPKFPQLDPKELAFRRKLIRMLSEHVPDPVKPVDLSLVVIVFQVIMAIVSNLGFSVKRPIVVEKDRRLFLDLKKPDFNIAVLWRAPFMIHAFLKEDPGENWNEIQNKWRDYIGTAWIHDLNSADCEELLELYNRVMKSVEKFMLPRFDKVVVPGLLHEAIIKFLTRITLGKKRSPEINRKLFLALPFRTSQMNRALACLADTAAGYGKDSPEFDNALRAFLTEWGSRATRGMVAVPSFPTWNEDATMVHNLIDVLLQDSRDMDGLEKQQNSEYLEALEMMSKRLWFFPKKWFNNSLKKSRDNLVAREDSVFFGEKVTALLRKILLQIGSRLVVGGIIDRADDIFFLLSDEIAPSLQGNLDVRERIAYRSKAYSEACAGQSLGENYFEVLLGVPPEKTSQEKSNGHSNQLTGIPVSGGRATGPVCVVKSPAEFGKLKKGDILVAPATAPVWTPLFSIAAAVVTDTGGPLSHAAIVAREYGIPAVLGTGNATSILVDGQKVTVDGSNGLVLILITREDK